MIHVTPDEIATKFPALLEQMRQGQELFLEVEGKVVAKVCAVEAKGPSQRFGFAKGRFQVSDDFDAHLELVDSKDTKDGDTPKVIYREPGFAKGRFWVSEDFDEPLEDFKPYM